MHDVNLGTHCTVTHVLFNVHIQVDILHYEYHMFI